MQTNQLSKREREVIKLLLQGKSNKLIAISLDISDRTVEFHLKNIYAKYQVNSRLELILKLVNATGGIDIEKLGSSTVDDAGKIANNGGAFNSQKDWLPSPFSERTKIMSANVRKIIRNALTGFVPSVFLVMIVTVFLDGIRYFARNQNWETFIDGSIRSQNFWEVFVLELLLLTGGYIFTTILFNPHYLSFTWWRSALAGIGAVTLLALTSILVQPASFLVISLASLFTGGVSVLFMWTKAPRTMTG